MAKYRSEDEAPIVENPAVGDNEEVIVAAAGTEPDMPPTTPIDPIAEVDSTRSPEADPTVPEQRFRFRSEGEEVEAPAAPIDAPAEAPAADAAPADAPAAAPVGPEVAPEAAPMEAPVADVPAAAPMAEPQPEVEVAPAAPAEGEVPAAAPVAPEVAAAPEVGAVEPAAAAPEEAPVDNAPVEQRFKQEGEEISVVATEEPKAPVDTEVSECPVSGEPCVDKDVKEPINPVIEQEDEVAKDIPADIPVGDEAGGTEPAPMETKSDITDITPEEAEQEEAAVIDEVEQCMRMEGETEGGDVDEGDGNGGESGDQSVKVNVAVEGPDTDAHEGEDAAPLIADAVPSQRFKQEDNAVEPIETVADVATAPAEAPVAPEVAEEVVPTPDPNAGNPDPDQCFNSFMSEGGSWL